jgi:hypothetical protein
VVVVCWVSGGTLGFLEKRNPPQGAADMAKGGFPPFASLRLPIDRQARFDMARFRHRTTL